jgi:hypothetical protein
MRGRVHPEGFSLKGTKGMGLPYNIVNNLIMRGINERFS